MIIWGLVYHIIIVSCWDNHLLIPWKTADVPTFPIDTKAWHISYILKMLNWSREKYHSHWSKCSMSLNHQVFQKLVSLSQIAFIISLYVLVTFPPYGKQYQYTPLLCFVYQTTDHLLIWARICCLNIIASVQHPT